MAIRKLIESKKKRPSSVKPSRKRIEGEGGLAERRRINGLRGELGSLMVGDAVEIGEVIYAVTYVLARREIPSARIQKGFEKIVQAIGVEAGGRKPLSLYQNEDGSWFGGEVWWDRGGICHVEERRPIELKKIKRRRIDEG